MKPLLMAVALSTLCLGACETTRVLVPIKPDPSRLDCYAAGDRPALPPEYVIDWNAITTVPQAKTEHEAYVRSVRSREGVVVGHIVEIEGALWACASDDEWLRDWLNALPDPG